MACRRMSLAAAREFEGLGQNLPSPFHDWRTNSDSTNFLRRPMGGIFIVELTIKL